MSDSPPPPPPKPVRARRAAAARGQSDGGQSRGGQSRGEEARLRILEAAIEEFATSGYRGASTRQLAGRAGVNLGALTYYFDSKPLLYRAALDHVVGRVDDVMRPVAQRLVDALAAAGQGAGQGPGQVDGLLAVLLDFLDYWLDIMLGRSNLKWQPSWSLLLTRAEVEPPEGDIWPYTSTYALMRDPFAAAIARITGRADVDDECRILTVSLLGQATAFRRQLDGQLRVLGWSSLDDARRDAISAVLRRNTIAALGSAKIEHSVKTR
jgi:AcrR family transcriptional regulator